MATKRRYSAFDDLSSDDQDDNQRPMALLGAAFDLGRMPQQSQQPTQQQQPKQYAEPVSDSRANRPQQASVSGGGMSDAERFDVDRINSLDNTLSAAQRVKGFMRYTAKYGNVASFGSR